jgi:alpha/beta superfamily hydrolase
MPARTEKIWLDGPAGRLEALLDTPADPAGVAVVCHPHPEGGGTMRNKVVHTLTRAFARSGFTTLRFNFRGTGASEGSFDGGDGEVDDALAALAFMRAQQTQGSSWLAGFSFGAAIAIRAAVRAPVDGLISVAPAARRFASGLPVQPHCPWLIVQGDADELVDVEETISWVNELEPGPELLVLEGVDHFFHGRLNELRNAAADFIERSME